MLTKEKLHHYLAFECPIREIAAVLDRHCLDSPRTAHVHARSGTSFSCTDLRGGVYCSLRFSYSVSLSFSLPLPSLSSFRLILAFSIALALKLPSILLGLFLAEIHAILSFCSSCGLFLFLFRFHISCNSSSLFRATIFCLCIYFFLAFKWKVSSHIYNSHN